MSLNPRPETAGWTVGRSTTGETFVEYGERVARHNASPTLLLPEALVGDAAGRDSCQAPIVLNATALFREGSGVQTYARELIHSLPSATQRPIVAIADRQAVDLLPEDVASRPRVARSGWQRKLQGLRSVPDAALVHGLDVDVPLTDRVARVATVHDLSVFDTPWAFSRLSGYLKRRMMARSCAAADVLLAVSAFTAERIERHFGREAVVVHEAPRAGLRPATDDAVSSIRETYGLPKNFVLYVGNLEPRKDIPTLAAACSIAGIPLVLAGGSVRTVSAPSKTRWIGYVPDESLPALYGAATIVAYVSRYEGFGLPPIEALACGATVMATRVGALGEIAPEGIEYVPVGDAEAQARTLTELLGDEDRRAARKTAGLTEAAALSWSRTARETVAVYRSLGIQV